MADQLDDFEFVDAGGDDEEQARSGQLKDNGGDGEGDPGDGAMPPVGRQLTGEEQQLKRFAGRIGLVEKIGSQVKGMTCAWASFVLLGAFSNNLAMRDFWFATIILLQAKISLFNYNYVLTDWGQPQQTTSPPFSSRGGRVRKPKPTKTHPNTTTTHDHVIITDHDQSLRRRSQQTSDDSQSRQTTSKHISPAQLRRLFSYRRGLIVLVYLIEFSSGILFLDQTVAVPARVLVAQGQDANTSIARNKKYSLVLFYCLIILESVLFLSSHIYYFVNVVMHREFHTISSKLGFRDIDHQPDLIPVQAFFFDCLNSSNGRDDRDMVTFGVDLLASDLQDKQLVGVRILSTFVRNRPDDFSRKVVLNIGANLKALLALVKILDNCRLNDDGDDYDERFLTWESAATVLSKLTTVEENGFRVYQIPGSIQIICSRLLQKGGGNKGSNYNYCINTTRQLGSEILANLAKEEDARDVIGRTGSGGVLKKLLKIFFKKGTDSGAAGKAIAMLTFQGESNCQRILKLNLFNRFIKVALSDDPTPVFGLHAKKILSNLCMYSGPTSDDQLKPIIQAAPTVFKKIVDEDSSSENGKEIVVGIASYTCKSKTLERLSVSEFGVEEDGLAAALVEMLIKCKDDPIIARSIVEVATWMMTNSTGTVHTFMEMDLESILKAISDTADEEESDDFELQFVVDTALEILKRPTI